MRVHVTSIMPRSGTTLLAEMMIACFEFDGYSRHELEIVSAPAQRAGRFLSKRPGDLEFARWMLPRFRDLRVVVILRDPRDVIVSRHRKLPEAFWANLGVHKKRMGHFRSIKDHPNVTVVRYEDLVRDPDRIQRLIETRIPSLVRKAEFSEFHDVARPVPGSIEALGGVRRVSDASIGKWRHDLPRIKAQIERYGGMDALLGELGYAGDPGWTDALSGVAADNGIDRVDDLKDRPARRRRRLRRYLRLVLVLVGRPRRRNIITSD